MERLPEAPPGLLKAQWQTFHGKAANLPDKSHQALGLTLSPGLLFQADEVIK